MGLDLRLPLGLMFLSIGVLMAGYGLFTWHDPMYLRSMGQNVNMIWGGAMSLFGLVMLLLARRAHGRKPQTEIPAARPAPARNSH